MSISTILSISILTELDISERMVFAEDKKTIVPYKATNKSIGEKFTQQGTITSIPGILPGHETHQIAFPLPLREDDAIYTGDLTYTASAPVQVVIFNKLTNSTTISNEFGTLLTAPSPLDDGLISISVIFPEYNGAINSHSLPVSGNAIALHTLDGTPFVSTYSISGSIEEPEIFNHIEEMPRTN